MATSKWPHAPHYWAFRICATYRSYKPCVQKDQVRIHNFIRKGGLKNFQWLTPGRIQEREDWITNRWSTRFLQTTSVNVGFEPGMAAQACNPSYSVGIRQEDHKFKAILEYRVSSSPNWATWLKLISKLKSHMRCLRTQLHVKALAHLINPQGMGDSVQRSVLQWL